MGRAKRPNQSHGDAAEGEREHIKKNQEDLKAFKVVMTKQVEVAETAEQGVKEHLHNMRRKNIGKLELSCHVVHVEFGIN